MEGKPVVFVDNQSIEEQPVIIALTMASSPKDRRAAKRSDIDNVLIKPAHLDQLASIIQYYFGIASKEEKASDKNEAIEI